MVIPVVSCRNLRYCNAAELRLQPLNQSITTSDRKTVIRSMTIYPLAILMMLSLSVSLQAQEVTPEPASATLPEPITERFAAPRLTRAERLALILPADTELQSFETGSETYYALIQLANATDSHGSILILPDIVSGDAWVEQSAHMRHYLADHGWTVLVMEMPLPTPPLQPERTLPLRIDLPVVSDETAPAQTPPPATEAALTAAPERSPESDATQETRLQPYIERISQRISNGLEELRLRNSGAEERSVIVAIGSSAGWAANYIQQMPEQDRPVLLMIDPRPSLSTEQPDLLTSISTLRSLIIDLYHTPPPGHPVIVPDARHRQLAARRSAHPDYHQARISGTFRGWNNPWLSRQIRGKLKRYLLELSESGIQSEEAAPTQQRPPGRTL